MSSTGEDIKPGSPLTRSTFSSGWRRQRALPAPTAAATATAARRSARGPGWRPGRDRRGRDCRVERTRQRVRKVPSGATADPVPAGARI